MKFGETIKNSMDSVGNFTEEQLEKRKQRLEDPVLQAELEKVKNNLKGDIKRTCAHGLEAVYRFTLTAPINAVWEGGKEFVNVVENNFAVKKSSDKKSYFNVPGAMVAGLLEEWGKGAVSTTKFAGNLSMALGRTAVLGGRYTIGK